MDHKGPPPAYSLNVPSSSTPSMPFSPNSFTIPSSSHSSTHQQDPIPTSSIPATNLTPTASIPANSNSSSSSRFACLTFDKDALAMTNFDREATFSIQSLLERTWSAGIKETKTTAATTTLHLEGRPWHYVKKSQPRLQQARLGTALLQCLYKRGLVAVSAAGIDSTLRNHARPTMMLRRQTPSPAPCTWMSVTFHEGDTLLLADAPPPTAEEVLVRMGARVAKHKAISETAYKIRLKGKPWLAALDKVEEPQLLQLELLEVLEEQGFGLYAVAPIGAADSGVKGKAGDTWVCIRKDGR